MFPMDALFVATFIVGLGICGYLAVTQKARERRKELKRLERKKRIEQLHAEGKTTAGVDAVSLVVVVFYTLAWIVFPLVGIAVIAMAILSLVGLR